MNKEILKLCEKDKYQKIYLIIKSRMNNEEGYGKYMLSDNDINNLRGYFTNRIQKYLYKDVEIPQTLLNTSIYLGKQHMEQLRELICNYIIVQNSTELGYFIAQNFVNLDSLQQIYKELENLIVKITGTYNNLPEEWNIELKFIKKAYLIIKQRICDYFFVFEPDEISFTNGFLATIKFEKMTKTIFETKKCCKKDFYNERLRKLSDKRLNNEPLSDKRLNNEPLSDKRLNNELLTDKRLNNEPLTDKRLSNEPLSDKRLNNEPLTDKRLNNELLNNELLNNEPLSNELLSNELLSNELLNNEPLSNELLSNELLSNELLSNEPLSNELLSNEVNKQLINKKIYSEIRFNKNENILSKFEISLNKKTIIHSFYLKEEIECRHYNIISTLLLANVSLYYEEMFRFLKEEKINIKCYEIGIIKIFPDFFRKVEKIYECVEHFNDINVFTKFLNYVDYYLSIIWKKIKPTNELEHGTCILSTVLYVRETMENLVKKNEEINIELPIFSLITQTENNQNKKIETFLNENFIQIEKKQSNFINLKKWLEKYIFYKEFVNDDVRYILIEMSLAILFGKISQFKMSAELANLFYNDMNNLEEFLGIKYEAVPHLKVIKSYLKIFICPTLNKEKYIKMFVKLSKNTFNFKQILYAMEDQEEAMKLFTEFKHRCELEKIMFEI